MNIAVIITNTNQSGGAFQYELLNLTILRKYKNNNFKFFFYCESKKISNYYKTYNIEINLIKKNLLQKLNDFFFNIRILKDLLIYISTTFQRPKLKFLNILKFNFYSSLENRLNKDKVDLIYFTSPTLLYKQIRSLPFIFTVFDLNFHYQNYFPELSNNNEFLKRHNYYFESLNRAFKIIVCSNFLKKQIIQYYNILPERIEILPYLPNKKKFENERELFFKEKYRLSANYIFYPASFYPHKNHIYILKVLDYLNNFHNKNFYVYFVGTTPNLNSTLTFLKKNINQLNIKKYVKFFDFVEDESIQYFYKNAICLLMPSFNGPNNIPPLEAIINDCPLLYSDIPEFKEQFGNLVEYIDLKNPANTAKKVINLFEDNLHRKNIINTQIKYFENWNEDKFFNNLINIILDFKNISNNWKNYD